VHARELRVHLVAQRPERLLYRLTDDALNFGKKDLAMKPREHLKHVVFHRPEIVPRNLACNPSDPQPAAALSISDFAADKKLLTL
jgi:hypothetical protein